MGNGESDAKEAERQVDSLQDLYTATTEELKKHDTDKQSSDSSASSSGQPDDQMSDEDSSGDAGGDGAITYPPYPGNMTESDYQEAADLMLAKTAEPPQSFMTNMIQVMDCIPAGQSMTGGFMRLPSYGGIRVSGSGGYWNPDPQGDYCAQPRGVSSNGEYHFTPVVWDTFVPMTREQIDMEPQSKAQWLAQEVS